MSGNPKDGRPGQSEDNFLEADFDFGDDNTLPPSDGSDFDFNELPTPGRPPEPALPDADAAFGGEDEFGGIDDEDEVPVAVPRAPVRAAAAPAGDFDDVDGDGFEPVESDFDGLDDVDDEEIGIEGEAYDDRGEDDDVRYEDEEALNEVPRKNSPMGMAIMAGGVLLMCGVLFVAWTSVVQPILFGPDVPQQTQMATTVPGIPAPPPGIPGLQQTGTGQPALPGLPSLPAPSLPQQAGNQPALPQMADPLQLPGLDAPAPSRDLAAMPAGTGDGRVVEGAVVDRALVQRVEAMETALRETAPERVLELQDVIRQLEERLAAVETREPRSDVPVVAGPPRPSVEPPSKPAIVDGWTLRGVSNGVAWVEGESGLIEVREGSEVPGVGTVRGIQRYEREWVVVTSNGVIQR